MAKSNWLFRLSVIAARTTVAFSAVVMLVTFGAATPTKAQGAWCAEYSGEASSTNCGFYTIEQCRMAISGVGGFCSPSPFVGASNPPPRRNGRRYQ
jgi:hypothetical protein